jgi:rhodanese-related sulfurtransferase
MSFLVGSHIQFSPAEAYERCLHGSVLLDVRPGVLCNYKTFDVPMVLYCPWQELEKFIDQLPADQELIIADTSGIQNREVMELLLKHDFQKIAGLAGGMVEWERDGLPLRLDNQSRLSGSCMCQLKFRERK